MTPITTHSFLDEEVTVILTREELYRIREWNKHEMGRAQQGMDAINSKPAKRSMRQQQYEFHKRLCDRLYGVEPNEDELVAEHNAELMRQSAVIEEQMKLLRDAQTELKRQLV